MYKLQEKGLRNFETLVQSHPVVARKAAALALNHGGRRAVTLGSQEITKQVNLTRAYVRKGLKIRQHANPNNLITIIGARQRATSLRRYSQVATRKGRAAGVRTGVGGSRKLLRRAFIIKLNRGSSQVDGFNEGVAIRLKSGESIENKVKAFSNDPGLYLLYGPSVDQLFQTVRDDIHPDVIGDMNNEFNRQFARLLR